MVMFFSEMFSSYLEFALSFGFTFAVVLGVLNVSKVFGDPKTAKRVNVLLAVVIGVFASFSEAYISFLFQWMFYLIGIFVVVFVVLIFKNLFYSGEQGSREEKSVTWPMVMSVVILFLVFLGFYQFIPLPSGQLISSEDVALVIGIALVILILVIGSRAKFEEGRRGQQTTGGVE